MVVNKHLFFVVKLTEIWYWPPAFFSEFKCPLMQPNTKAVFVGSGGVGKTCLIITLGSSSFPRGTGSYYVLIHLRILRTSL